MTGPDDRPTLLLVGGGGGLVGRYLLPEIVGEFRIRSVHRHPVAAEAHAGIEWIAADLGGPVDWVAALEGVDAVVNLAWYRWARPGQFRSLYGGLHRLLAAARDGPRPRFVHVSVPPAPPELEEGLPYLAYKRAFDRELVESGLSYRIVRPTMLFGPGDRLLGVMLRLMRRYRVFPMFGDGTYHVSPLAVDDLASILRREVLGRETGIVEAGGPARFEYRDLTDLMFRILGQPPRYWRISPRASVVLAQLVQDLGSTLLYAYEVEWLLSDRLGHAPYSSPELPLQPVEPYLRQEALRLRRGFRGRGARPSIRG
ncbi:MAG: NAD(P)H-binding protein [Thermoplasmata archaeon]|nr:NAD(P)H-binding protein [Thermoplasmata archaeon]